MTGDLDALVDFLDTPEVARTTALIRNGCRHLPRSKRIYDQDGYRCTVCGRAVAAEKARAGRTHRKYGNAAELAVARLYGGEKVGHHGGPVDVRGKDFATQVKTHRRKPPAEWTVALAAMDGGNRIPRLLVRFVHSTGPSDFLVFRAADFLDWFGRDE